MKEVRPGLEVLLEERLSLVHGTSVGLITNPSGVDRQLRSGIDLLAAHPDVTLAAIFGPEHGLSGATPAGQAVGHTIHPRLGIPVYSLYGPTSGFTEDTLADLDVLLFDIQDVGSRYFTYAGTLLQAMQSAGREGVRVLVLDRPNPITDVLGGPVLETDLRSLVGVHEVPVRHGMTLGELARLMQARHRGDDGSLGVDVDLEVVRMRGWERTLWYDETGLTWVPPSPNIPTLGTATVYPGTCLFEGTNISEGRGTPLPFELVGAPWADGESVARDVGKHGLPGVRFRPAAFVPTSSKYAGEVCRAACVSRPRAPGGVQAALA